MKWVRRGVVSVLMSPMGGGGVAVRKIVRGPENSDKWIL